MRKAVFLGMVSIVLALAFYDANVGGSILAFLLTGAIPGTPFSIPANIMLVGFFVALWALILQTTAFGALHIVTMKRLVTRHIARADRLPRRRFGNI